MRLPFIPKAIVQAVIQLHPMVCADGRYWEWTGTHWYPIRENVLTWFTEKLDGHEIWHKDEATGAKKRLDNSGQRVGNALDSYIRRSPELNRRNFFEKAPRGLTVGNGFLQFADDGSIQLHPHAQTFRSRYYIDADYDASATCPYTLEILDSYFVEDVDNDGPDKKRAILEFLALCLFAQANADRRGKILWITGPKGSGKTTLMENILDAVFDIHNPDIEHGMVSSVEPHKFHESRERTKMVGCVINYKDEVEARAVKDAGIMKQIVSGSPVGVQWLWKDLGTARLKCGHLFLANTMSLLADSSGALHDRVVYIRFNRYQRRDEKPQVIAAKIKAERVGIIALLCKVYHEMVQRDPDGVPTMIVPESAKRYQIEAAAKANTLHQFVEQRCTYDEGAKRPVSAEEIYDNFNDWRTWNGKAKNMNVDADMLAEALLEVMPSARGPRAKNGAQLYLIRLGGALSTYPQEDT